MRVSTAGSEATAPTESGGLPPLGWEQVCALSKGIGASRGLVHKWSEDAFVGGTRGYGFLYPTALLSVYQSTYILTLTDSLEVWVVTKRMTLQIQHKQLNEILSHGG